MFKKLKNPYINCVILFLILILHCLNNYLTQILPWYNFLDRLFEYSLYLIIFLVIINGLYFFKKSYLLGIFQILFGSFLVVFLLIINSLNTSYLIDYLNFGSDYKIKVEYLEENNMYYFIQKDRFLYFFAKQHCLYKYIGFPGEINWEKIDKNNIRIRGKVFTLKKAPLLSSPACNDIYN